jgi:hypothetical protein
MSEEKKKRLLVKFDYEINYDSFDNLLDFLLARETDIALDIEDFGTLKGIFIDLFDTEPKED